MNWVVIVLFCIIPMVAWAATLIAMKGYTLTGAKMKEIQFKNAYIVHYSETLDANNDVPMTITITFSAEEIIVGSAALDNRWPKK